MAAEEVRVEDRAQHGPEVAFATVRTRRVPGDDALADQFGFRRTIGIGVIVVAILHAGVAGAGWNHNLVGLTDPRSAQTGGVTLGSGKDEVGARGIGVPD